MMSSRTALAATLAFATLSIGTTPACSADLADRRIERLFAGEPVPAARPYAGEDSAGVFIPFAYAPGYYGRVGDFGRRNYYGTSVWDIFSRAPYACWPAPSGVC